MACPQCGSGTLGRVSDHYLEEVRKPGANPAQLDAFAPPSRKALLYGTLFGFFAWLGLLAPFFAPEGAMLRTSVPVWLLALVWAPLFWRARKTDRLARAAYEARRICPACGWHD